MKFLFAAQKKFGIIAQCLDNLGCMQSYGTGTRKINWQQSKWEVDDIEFDQYKGILSELRLQCIALSSSLSRG